MQNSELLDDNVYAILPDGEQNLWLGTLQALIRFNPEKRSFTVIDKEKNGNEEFPTAALLLFSATPDNVFG